MLKRDALIEQMAEAKADARALMEKAITDVLAASWDFQSERFSFEDYPELDREVNRILRDLSDQCYAKARERVERILIDAELDAYEEDAIGYADEDMDGKTPLYRFDMHSTHLKDLLAAWIAVSAYAGWTRAQTAQKFWIYVSNPAACPQWIAAGLRPLHWGKGYGKNVFADIARLMQDYINKAVKYAQIQGFADEGAIGYTVHRGSNYNCPLCDSFTGRVYPLTEIVVPIHPNCVCYIEPVYEAV